jgi:hypothetical protein
LNKFWAYAVTAAAGVLWILGCVGIGYGFWIGSALDLPMYGITFIILGVLLFLFGAVAADYSANLREAVRDDEQLEVLRDAMRRKEKRERLQESVREAAYRDLTEGDINARR